MGVGRVQCHFCTLESTGDALRCEGALGIEIVGDMGRDLYSDTFGILYNTLKYFSGIGPIGCKRPFLAV